MSRSLHHETVELDGAALHVVLAGEHNERTVVLLHGWPQSSRAWEPVMALASADHRCIAVDLPGIGGSTETVGGGSKRHIAARIHELLGALGVEGDITLVGHDAGGMVAYAYLRCFTDVNRVVILDTVVPGVEPWSKVIANPYVFHFGLHAVPGLPELLVKDRQAPYFDYFYDALTTDPTTIPPEARAAYAEAYGTDAALTAGFDLYRAFAGDAEDNTRWAGGPPVETPLLYLRGTDQYGDLTDYIDGFRDAGVRNLTAATIEGAGHFTPEEQPERLWALVEAFTGGT